MRRLVPVASHSFGLNKSDVGFPASLFCFKSPKATRYQLVLVFK
jgi:hypothetical protein